MKTLSQRLQAPLLPHPQDFLCFAWGPGEGRGRDDLQMLDLLLGLGKVQLHSCECAVQAAFLCVQAQCILMASQLLALRLGRNMEGAHRSSAG